MTTKNTTLISNYEAKPLVASPLGKLGGTQQVIQDSVACLTTDLEAADIIMLAPVPSNARVSSIRLAADDLDGDSTPTLAFNLGLYTSGGVLVDADAYASAITLGQAATAHTEYAFEARGIEKTGQQVWQDAGASADPGGYYYLALTVSTVAATPAAGDIAFIVEYAID